MTTQLSNERLEEIKEVFEIFDHDKDGHITTKELVEIFRGLGHTPSATEMEDILKEADVDQSGTIEYNEFLKLYQKKMRPPDSEDELREAFEVFDRDGNGLISSQELIQAMMTCGEKISREEAEDMIRMADINRDGFIDYLEFAKFMKA